MVIATGDGLVFKDRFDQLSQQFWPAQEESDVLSSGRDKVASNYPNPFEDVGKYTPKAPTSAPEPPKPLWPHELLSPTPPALWHWEHHTDNEHHVPLIASGILDDAGNMTGLAIDHRVDVPKEYLPHLALHEATEIPLMHNYMADGMSAQDAYHKAHDIATATESASVRAHAARNGLDPDKYQADYQQFFRDAGKVAGEPSGRERHERAHTSVHNLDHHELGYPKLAGPVTDAIKEWLFGQNVEPGKTYSPKTPMQMPTDEEAEQARKGELSYGSPHAAFEEGERGRAIKSGVIGPIYNKAAEEFDKGGKGFQPDTFDILKKVPSRDVADDTKKYMANLYTKAQIVANRSPVLALGFDPRHAAIDFEKNVQGVLGFYDKNVDQAWVSTGESDVLVHEMAHRGLRQLVNSGKLNDEEERYINNHDIDEAMVQYLTHKYASTDSNKPNVELATTHGYKVLEGIEKKAQELYQEKYGKGPH